MALLTLLSFFLVALASSFLGAVLGSYLRKRLRENYNLDEEGSD